MTKEKYIEELWKLYQMAVKKKNVDAALMALSYIAYVSNLIPYNSNLLNWR